MNGMTETDRQGVIAKLNTIMETEQAGVVCTSSESLEHEKTALAAYYALLDLAGGKSVLLEDYAREMIVLEELHLDEVDKMLRRPETPRCSSAERFPKSSTARRPRTWRCSAWRRSRSTRRRAAGTAGHAAPSCRSRYTAVRG